MTLVPRRRPDGRVCCPEPHAQVCDECRAHFARLFTPRRRPDGRVCCSQFYALCPQCERHFGFRTGAAAPDPYEPQLAVLRAAAEPTHFERFEERWRDQRRREFGLDR